MKLLMFDMIIFLCLTTKQPTTRRSLYVRSFFYYYYKMKIHIICKLALFKTAINYCFVNPLLCFY